MAAEPKPVNPEQLAILRVPVKCIPTVIAALRAAGYPTEAGNVESFTAMYTRPDLNAVREDWIRRAEEQRQKDGDIEFDSDATISRSQDAGEYVLGWVWVDGPPENEEEDDGED